MDKGPERIPVNMPDPLLEQGSAHAAIVPVTVVPSGLSCKGELWLTSDGVTKKATSGFVNFTSTGVVQSVRFPITMPTVAGEYMVYIDIYTNTFLIAAAKNKEGEEVICPGGEIGDITWES